MYLRSSSGRNVVSNGEKLAVLLGNGGWREEREGEEGEVRVGRGSEVRGGGERWGGE
jgi:hypothetical protein